MMHIELKAIKDKRILCAVSGGADSMCMLHFLWSEGLDIVVAHYEHGIRGKESLRDAEFVDSWCAERAIRCVIENGNVPEYAKANAMGLEEAARKLRYEFLFDTAKKLNCDLIATAHNADDNIETILMNLARGSGTQGLSGIPPHRDIIIRPLLAVSREEIELYIKENSILHIHDSTNESDEYTRNLIRHRVVPVLKQINPKLSAAANRSSMLLRCDDDCLVGLAQDFIRRFYNDYSLPVSELLSLHTAISSRVLRILIGRACSMDQIITVLDFCSLSGYASLDLPGIRLVRDQGRLFFASEDSVKLPERELVVGQALNIPEAGLVIKSEYSLYNGEINDLFKTYYIKCENISKTVYCGGRMPGDRIRPINRGCSKSIKSLFMEAGYTQAQRNKTPIIRDANGVLIVYGLAADERTKPSIGERVLKLRFCDLVKEG